MTSSHMLWDCFMFNDEVDLLRFRLEEYADVVDRVLIVEATTTFSGRSKRLHFEDHAAAFADHASRIVHRVVDLESAGGWAWDAENEQRRHVRDALLAVADPGDLVLLGDVDEFPYRQVLRRLDPVTVQPTRLVLRHAVFAANLELQEPFLEGPIVCRLDQRDHPMVRLQLGEGEPPKGTGYREPRSPGAGWHLSFLGTTDRVSRKLDAYSHQEYNTPAVRERIHLERCREFGVHFHGRAVMRRIQRAELDPFLRRVYAFCPGWFVADTPTPSTAASEAYCAFAWLRAGGRVPGPVLRWLDLHPKAVIGWGRSVFLTLQVALRLRRWLRPPDDDWRLEADENLNAG